MNSSDPDEGAQRRWHSRLTPWFRRPRLKWTLGLLAILGIALLIMWPRPRDYRYETAPLSMGSVERVVSATGKLRARNSVKVGAEVSGQVKQVLVNFNSPVRAGQVLAVIDPTRIQARLDQANAQSMTARASLAQAEAAVARAETDIAVQDRALQRHQALANKGFVSRSMLDQVASQRAAARAQKLNALAQVQTARAQIAQAAAEQVAVRLDYSRTTILSPVDGVVIDRLIDPGQTVVASFQTPNLFEIAADTRRMQIEASVDEADIGQVRPGQKVRFTVDAYPTETFQAVVSQVRQAAVINQNVVSYLAIIDVDNPHGKLLSGMTTSVEIITATRPRTLRMPVGALAFRPKPQDRPDQPAKPAADPPSPARNPNPARSATVWVAGDDPYRPQPRRIILGIEGENEVEVLQGLNTKDRVLVRVRSTRPKASATQESDTDETQDGA